MNVVKSILISLAVLLVGGGCGVIIGANVVDLDYSESEYIEYGEQQKQEGLNEGLESLEEVQAKVEELEKSLQDAINSGNVDKETIEGLQQDLAEAQKELESTLLRLEEMSESLDNALAQGELDQETIAELQEDLEAAQVDLIAKQEQIEELENELKSYTTGIFDVFVSEDAICKRVSDSRVLITSNNCLYSLSSNGNFKQISNPNNPMFGFEWEYNILETGDVFFVEANLSPGLYLYEYDTETLICLNDSALALDVSGSYFKILKDGSFVISGQSSSSNETLIISSDYSVIKSFENYRYVSFIEYTNDCALFKAYNNSLSSYVYLLLNLQTKVFSEITGPISSTSCAFNFSLDNGDILMSTYGAGGLYLYDATKSSISLLTSELPYCENYFKTSNNKVLCAGDSSTSNWDGGFWVYDIETKKIKKISDNIGFKYFLEDENGVTVAISETASTKYYYDFATESFSVLENN